jgi:hypothetical protein
MRQRKRQPHPCDYRQHGLLQRVLIVAQRNLDQPALRVTRTIYRISHEESLIGHDSDSGEQCQRRKKRPVCDEGKSGRVVVAIRQWQMQVRQLFPEEKQNHHGGYHADCDKNLLSEHQGEFRSEPACEPDIHAFIDRLRSSYRHVFR